MDGFAGAYMRIFVYSFHSDSKHVFFFFSLSYLWVSIRSYQIKHSHVSSASHLPACFVRSFVLDREVFSWRGGRGVANYLPTYVVFFWSGARVVLFFFIRVVFSLSFRLPILDRAG